jgi:Zn-dependent protease with chaperone function
VDDAPSCRASWYDGRSAVRHEGRLTLDAGRLVLSDRQGVQQYALDPAELKPVERPGARAFGLKDDSGFRLLLPDEAPASITRRLPAERKYGRWIKRTGLVPAAIMLAVLSAGVVTIVLATPQWLGPLVPYRWEQQLGSTIIGDLGGRVCSTEAGEAALAKLFARVDDGGPPIEFGVANNDMVNAVALPGGKVLLFDGLIQQAESPEEVAAVLAHEIGHVRERHVMSAMIRQFGLGLLTSGIDGRAGSFLLGLATMTYSREAEREADRWALRSLMANDVSPLGGARFFERMQERRDGRPAGWLESHPADTERAAVFRRAASSRQFRPVLTEQEFAALKSICANDPGAQELQLF